MTRTNVEMLSHAAYNLARSVFPKGNEDGPQVVRLKDGGVLITSPDGDHVHIFVQTVHFEPGEALPF